MSTTERPDSRVEHCFKCGAGRVVGITYASIEGHPVQRGVCSDCATGGIYLDRLPTNMQTQEG